MRILTLTTPDIENGLGVRVTLWFAGCTHRCPGCHNEHTWDYNQGKQILDDAVLERIFNECNHDYVDGITLSGGDPLDQSKESLHELHKFIKWFKHRFPDKDIWLYTGSNIEDITDSGKYAIICECAAVVDGPFVKELYNPDLAFRGSSNQRIIKVLHKGKRYGCSTDDIKNYTHVLHAAVKHIEPFTEYANLQPS